MITKHRVSNVIVMIGETDAALPLICLRDKENTSHKRKEAKYRDKTNIGVVFDAHAILARPHKG